MSGVGRFNLHHITKKNFDKLQSIYSPDSQNPLRLLIKFISEEYTPTFIEYYVEGRELSEEEYAEMIGDRNKNYPSEDTEVQ